MVIRADSFALTPAGLYAPVAQHALRGLGAAQWPDRSGNGRHLDTTLIAGYAPDGYAERCLAGKLRAPVAAPLQIVGDLTVTVRACCRYTGERQFLITENDGTAVAGPYCFIVEPDGTFYIGVETSNQIGYGFLPRSLRALWGRWALYSFRRNVAAGTWTVGVNKNYETSPAMTVTVPLNGTQPRLFVGGPDVGTLVWRGAMADVSIWDKCLNDAEVSGIVNAVGIDTTVTPAQFMPTLYSPVALYGLDFSGSEAAGLADRSGNGKHLTKVSLVGTQADRVPSAASARGSSGVGTKFVQGALGSADATWAITGPFTVLCRVLFDGDVSRTQVLYQSNYYPYTPSPVRCVPFTLATVGPDGALLSYTQHGSNTADAWTSALKPPVGRWSFISYRRAANGVLTVGVDFTFQDSPVIALPTTAPGVQLGVMNSNDGIAPLAWGGGMADLGVWGARLTDEQLQPLFRAAMGRAP